MSTWVPYFATPSLCHHSKLWGMPQKSLGEASQSKQTLFICKCALGDATCLHVQVDRAKGMRAIAERRAAKQAGAGQQGPNGVGGAHSDSASVPQQGSAADVGGNHEGGNKKGSRTPFSRNFTQRAAKADPTTDAAAPQLAEDVLLMVGKSKKKPRVE